MKRDQEERNRRSDEAEYEARLIKYIDQTVDTGLQYVAGAVTGWFVGSVEHRQAQTAMRGRLRMLRAVSSGKDEEVAKDLFETFTVLSEHGAQKVQVSDVSLLLDFLTGMASKDNDRQEIVDESRKLRAKVEGMPKTPSIPHIS